jgi:hypothetical protein
MSCIIGYDHSLDRKDILKSVYYFMILFFTIYIFEHVLVLVPSSNQESAIISSF